MIICVHVGNVAVRVQGLYCINLHIWRTISQLKYTQDCDVNRPSKERSVFEILELYICTYFSFLVELHLDDVLEVFLVVGLIFFAKLVDKYHRRFAELR